MISAEAGQWAFHRGSLGEIFDPVPEAVADIEPVGIAPSRRSGRISHRHRRPLRVRNARRKSSAVPRLAAPISCRIQVVHFELPATSSLDRGCPRPAALTARRSSLRAAADGYCWGRCPQRWRPAARAPARGTHRILTGPLSVGAAPAARWWGSRARCVWGSGRPSPCAPAARILARKQAGRR